MTMCFINARALDTMSQDWNPDTYQWTDLLEVPEVQNQGEFIQSDLSGSTDSTLQNSGHTGLEDPDLFDWMDPSALTSDFDNTLALDTDSIAIGCTSDSSPPRISKRKKKQKEKQVCPATSTSPSTSGVEELDCTPESQICPIGKTALCCNGEKEAWERWYGHSVGGCIKCNRYIHPMLHSVFGILT